MPNSLRPNRRAPWAESLKKKLCRRGISSGIAGSGEEGAHGGGIDGDGAGVGGGIRLLAARLSVEAIPTSFGDHIPRMELEGLKLGLVLGIGHCDFGYVGIWV